MKKGLCIKLLITCILAFIFCGCWLYDSIRVREFNVDVVYVSNLNPVAEDVMDNWVTIRVQVTHNGTPCEGYEVEARTGESEGKLVKYFGKTDANGIIEFVYAPYDEKFKPAGRVTLTFLEMSNSKIIEVKKIVTYDEIVLKSKGA